MRGSPGGKTIPWGHQRPPSAELS